ncbi:MAG: carbamoyltransferase [Deltaproteobacteria bacterium]|nr:carbamoyltransferase [Deltaproteobacteria bacterium]
MTAILGISAFYHDSAAALLVDGQIVAAAQEERFTRKKHDAGFPARAIEFCLGQAGLRPGQLDYVCFYDKPLLKFERLLETYLAHAPIGFNSFFRAMPLWLKKKLHLSREIRRGLASEYKRRIVFAEHHESHAASAFFPSPFSESAVLTIDGVGEWATASFGVGRGNQLNLTHELRFPHSLGLLYSAFTYFAGFKVNSGEYKLMGLAPYGEPRYAKLILERLIDLKEDGSFRMDMSYFNYCQGLTMTSKKFEELFDGPQRLPESKLTQREMDIAASIQQVTEDIVLRMARHVHARTGMKHLCLAGGVALNCVANGRVLSEGPFEDIWVQPAAGDAGGALGAALFTWHQLLGKPREPGPKDSQRGSLLGPSFSDDAIAAFLDGIGARYTRLVDDDALCEHVAALLAKEKVVGWMQGPMEFGPRALGSRSILGDPRSESMQSVMNLKIKFRESFRPFAPAVLAGQASEYFELSPAHESPYMLVTAPVRVEKRKEQARELTAVGLEKLKVQRSVIPAVTHVDFSARIQTVDAARHGRYHRLLEAFFELTGCPVLINTSFNVRGEPIACTPEDAYRCFMSTNMDVLVLERIVLIKEEQQGRRQHEIDHYLAQFELD